MSATSTSRNGNRIRTGVIGLGKMGENHARIYAELECCDLIGVVDANEDAARRGAAFSDCRAFRSVQGLVDAGVDAVSIAVPTTLHAYVAIEALRSGVHVLVEKPIASSREEALTILNASERYGPKVMVGHVERFNPAIQAMKALVAPDEIISMNMMRVGPLPPRIKDSGVIIDLAVHDIDLVNYMFESRPEAVYCVKSSNISRFEDTASILLQMRGGAGAQITTNWITPYKAREIQIVTADRLIKGNLLTQQVQEFSRYTDRGYVVQDIFVRQQEPLRAEIEAFLHAIETDSTPSVTGMDGLYALEAAERATTFGQLEPIAA